MQYGMDHFWSSDSSKSPEYHKELIQTCEISHRLWWKNTTSVKGTQQQNFWYKFYSRSTPMELYLFSVMLTHIPQLLFLFLTTNESLPFSGRTLIIQSIQRVSSLTGKLLKLRSSKGLIVMSGVILFSSVTSKLPGPLSQHGIVWRSLVEMCPQR